MAVLTVREKNQVTIPSRFLREAGLRAGDPIEFESLADGGIGIYPLGSKLHHESALATALRIAQSVPGIEDSAVDFPPLELELREVEW